MDARTTYIHYGNTKFDPNKGFPIRNREIPWNKPRGGFWASPVNCRFGWKDWCEAEDYGECNNDNAIIFRLKPGATIMYVDSMESGEQLRPYLYSIQPRMEGINFEKMVQDGWDGLEIDIRNACRGYEFLWDVFYGWDCDSIVILNPNVVEVV